MGRPRAGRVVLAMLGSMGVVLAWPASVGAHGLSGPEVRGEIVAVEPALGAIEVDLLGEDLVVTVSPGHHLEVPGYEGEPYLRVRPDGRVERNERAPSAVLNTDRLAVVDDAALAATGVDLAPAWTVVGVDGVARWHDHRVHWMGVGTPEAIDGAVVATWEVPVTVDGRAVVIRGQMVLVAPPPPWPWLAGAAGLALIVTAAAWRRPAPGAAVAAVAASGVAVVATGAHAGTEWADGEGVDVVAMVVAAAALAAATVGATRRRPGVRMGWVGLALVLLVVWSQVALEVLGALDPRSALGDVGARACVAVVLGATAGGLVSLLRAVTARTGTGRSTASVAAPRSTDSGGC